MPGSEFAERLGNAIAARRRARGLSQEQFAEAVGVSPVWASRIERGVGLPSLEVLAQIAVTLGSPMAEIVAGAESPGGGRASVQELDAVARELPDDAVDVLVAAARSMRDRWPRG